MHSQRQQSDGGHVSSGSETMCMRLDELALSEEYKDAEECNEGKQQDAPVDCEEAPDAVLGENLRQGQVLSQNPRHDPH